MEIALPFIIVAAIVFAFAWFVMGWRPGKYEEILRIIPDAGGHGWHVFGRRRHAMDEGSYSSVNHVFIRKRDRRAFGTHFCEWSGQTKTGSLRPEWGERFEDAWAAGRWHYTVQKLAKKSGLALSLATTTDNTPLPAGPVTVRQLSKQL